MSTPEHGSETCEEILKHYRGQFVLMAGFSLAWLILWMLVWVIGMPGPGTSLRDTLGWVIMFVPLGAYVIWLWREYASVRAEINFGVFMTTEGMVEKVKKDSSEVGKVAQEWIWVNGTKFSAIKAVIADCARQVRAQRRSALLAAPSEETHKSIALLNSLSDDSIAFRKGDRVRLEYLPQSHVIVSVHLSAMKPPDPYRVGDVGLFRGVHGRVVEVTPTSLVLETREGRVSFPLED